MLPPSPRHSRETFSSTRIARRKKVESGIQTEVPLEMTDIFIHGESVWIPRSHFLSPRPPSPFGLRRDKGEEKMSRDDVESG
jgi:hypothetical protein